MSNVQQHDVREENLTDAEDLLGRDRKLAKSVAATSRAPSPSDTHPDTDTVYEGDIEDASERHARIARPGSPTAAQNRHTRRGWHCRVDHVPRKRKEAIEVF